MKVPLQEKMVTFTRIFGDNSRCRCATSMTLASVVDKNRQAVDDEIVAIAASAAEAGGNELQAPVADGADYQAELFRSEGVEDHVSDFSVGFQSRSQGERG
jgi:hypothetical protein